MLRENHLTMMDNLRERYRERIADLTKSFAERMAKHGESQFALGRKKAANDLVLMTAARFLRPGDLVLDCGANLGQYTEVFAQTQARVIAYEPNPACAEILRQKFKDYDNVTIREQAVGDADEQVTLHYPAKYDPSLADTHLSQGASILNDHSAVDAGNSHSVDMVDICRIIDELKREETHIAVLKIDIEGAELPLMERFLHGNYLDDIPICAIETHEKNFPDLAEEFERLKLLLHKRYSPSHVFLDGI